MTLELLKNKLNKNKSDILFSEVIQVIENNYIFKPTAFKNGKLENNAGENSGYEGLTFSDTPLLLKS
ncbi:HopJ type III effector protein [Polaribacter sp.]|uniref:HopJ type III effector protein n=1 Tax=Polaribacter sp. TaxID=1920175 RepID=UPI0025EC7123|nr:HopJ type III effector protein [Polaribacter sp.]